VSLHRLLNYCLALCIAGILSTGYMLDGPTDHQAAQAQASSTQDAQQVAKAEQRKAQATKVAGVAL